jgi:DNA-binding response OmpR family regulator
MASPANGGAPTRRAHLQITGRTQEVEAEKRPATHRAAADASGPRPDTRRRVLLIEDDRDIAEAMSYQLDRAGLSVRQAHTGEEGLDLARRGVDLVLLDLNLPGMDGLEVCRMIRRQSATAHTPIIIVSARAEEVDRVLGLEMGADDYMVKPFSLKELAARCRAALRRVEEAAEPAQAYRDENFDIEFDAYLVRYRGKEVRLTHKEFDILRYLVERPARIITRERLLEAIWGYEAEIDARSIDAHIRRLRTKLGPAREHIETVVGLGYRFVR